MKKFLLVAALLLCIAFSAMAAETTYTGTVNPIIITEPGEHTVILNGVNIEAEDSPAIDVKSPATKLTIILKNGTENTLIGGYEYAGINNNGVSLVIRCENAGNGHECTDACGKLTVYGGYYAAGIGGNKNQDMTSSVTINGSNISIYADYDGTGIGSGYNASMTGDITINNGNISIDARYNGAGIGAGQNGTLSGNVTINGGTVYANCSAQGGEETLTYGEGIGGDVFTGNITINGGDVTALGGHGTAGIGGRKMTKTGTITINGGNVYADCYQHSAGIGGGIEMSGNILITGGKVIASGYVRCTGIGSGRFSSMTGTVTITGGEVTAYGESAIGTGADSTMNGNIMVDPAPGYMIIGEKGELHFYYSEEADDLIPTIRNLSPLDGSPFTVWTDVTDQLIDFTGAHFYVVPISDLPQTGDATNAPLLMSMAAAGMMGFILLLRKRNEA